MSTQPSQPTASRHHRHHRRRAWRLAGGLVVLVAASPCEIVLTLPTGHSPFFAAPEQLAEMLDTLA